MPNIPAALAVLEAHLVNAGSALPDEILDVTRGLPTGGRMLRYYWDGEVDPPRMGGPLVMNAEMVGERFVIAATWPMSDLSPELVTTIDVEMQLLAGEIRTRINGDAQLGGNVTDLELSYARSENILIANVLHATLSWNLDLAYVEYSIGA